MMRTMRENTKAIMLITAFAFVGLMVFEWGMDLSGQTSAQMSGGQIGRINGEAVTYEEFYAVYQNLYQQQQAMQDEPISQAQNREIEEAAWEQLVMDRLIRAEIERRGLRATEEEVIQAARFAPPPEFYSNPLFQTDGQFDLNKYQQFLASPVVDDQLLLQLEAYYRDMIPRNKLYQQVVSGTYVSDGELWQMWRDRNEKATIRYVALDPDAMVPEGAVTVSDAEVEAFYRAHRNDFLRPATASLQIVVIDKTPAAADTAAALQRALEVRQEILDGADFAEVARRESADPGSAARGGDLGTFSKGQMVKPFEDAVWSLRLNRVSEPVLSQFGYHLIEVQSRSGDQATARHILIPIELTPEREDELFDRADELEDLGQRHGLASAAEQMGLEVITSEITPELPIVAGIGQIADGADWAFHDAKVGEVSPVFETPSAFYMVQLVDRSAERTLTLEEAAPGIRSRILGQKRMEKARQTGREVVDGIRIAGSLKAAAEESGLPILEAGPFARTDFVPGIGSGNAVIGTAFGLQPGETSGLLEANGRLYIIELIERTEADREEFEAQKLALRQQVTQGMAQEQWGRFLTALRENAQIRDDRAKVLRASGDLL